MPPEPNGLITPTAPLPKRRHSLGRAVTEVVSIIFLFYANLLMGEFTASNGHGKTLAHALHNIVTPATFLIALVAALVGYGVFEFLRHKV